MPQTQRKSRPRGPGRPVGARPGEARDALLTAARRLMNEKGLPGVTAREVADRADLNAGLVRYYFGSKEGLLRAVVEQVAREGRDIAIARASREGDARSRLAGLIQTMIEHFAADPHVPRLLFEQVFYADDDVIDAFADEFARAHVEALRGVLEYGYQTGEFGRVDPEMAMAAISGACVLIFFAAPLFDRLFSISTRDADFVERYTKFVTGLVLDGLSKSEHDAQ